MMNRRKRALNIAIKICILSGFVFLQANASMPFSVLKKLFSFNTTIQTSILAPEIDNEIPIPWSESDENLETEADTNSESYSTTHHLTYPVFIKLNIRKQFNSDLFFSDHPELVSPPPEI